MTGVFDLVRTAKVGDSIRHGQRWCTVTKIQHRGDGSGFVWLRGNGSDVVTCMFQPQAKRWLLRAAPRKVTVSR